MGRSIRIVVKKDGGTEWDYNGFHGETCKTTHSRVLDNLKRVGLAIDAEATVSTPKLAEAERNRMEEETL